MKSRAAAPLIAALMLGFAGDAFALTRDEITAIRQTVQSQLDAFANDDAERAFALASRSIRRRFGSAQQFIALVRNDYPVVYRPASVEFYEADQIAGKVYLPVQLSDRLGQYWLAMYEVQRQPDGSWLINGSKLTRSRAQMH